MYRVTFVVFCDETWFPIGWLWFVVQTIHGLECPLIHQDLFAGAAFADFPQVATGVGCDPACCRGFDHLGHSRAPPGLGQSVGGLTGVGGIQESWSATIRNLGLVVAGVLALGFAGWRTWVAHRQADLARQSLLDDRFQKATEMLGSPLMSVRLAGVYGLEALMKEYPDQYYVRGMRLMCAFVRSPTHADPDSPPKRSGGPQSGSAVLRTFVFATRLRQDVQAVMDVLRDRDAKWVALENESKFTPDLTGADLNQGDLNGANLSGVTLSWADLTAVNARGADLSHAMVESADFTQAVLAGAILTGVLFDEVTVTAAKFSSVGRDGTITEPAVGLTERSLLLAIAEEERLPQLSGVVNSADGSYIKWDGMTLGNVGDQS